MTTIARFATKTDCADFIARENLLLCYPIHSNGWIAALRHEGSTWAVCEGCESMVHLDGW